MMRSRPFAPAALVPALLLAACADDPAPAEDPVENVTVEEIAPPAPAAAPVETAAPATNEAIAAPAPEVEPDQQVLDDADATGMTARIDRSDAGGDLPPGEDGQPADAQ